MSKITTGVFAVCWEADGTTYMTKPISVEAPKAIKQMIAQSLLDELGVKVRIEL